MKAGGAGDTSRIDKRRRLEEKLEKYEGSDRVVWSFDLYNRLKEKFKERPLVSLHSGIPSIDLHMDGFEGGELTAISGLTGEGKTLLMQSFTKNFSKRKDFILWFSYEVQALQFLNKFDEIPHFLMPNELPTGEMKWIFERILEAKIKYEAKAVCIDHLHFLSDLLISKNPSLEIGRIIRTLKSWALELNMVFFLIAHMKKTSSKDDPGLGDIRDSSFIEQEADNVLYIWRDDKKSHNGAVLKIVKNRRRGVWNRTVDLLKIGSYLEEIGFDESGQI